MSCFNPRPRAGSDLRRVHTIDQFAVSIHAPAREATRRRCAAGAVARCAAGAVAAVSIHAPAREATRCSAVPAEPCTSGFNPRPRAGSDSAKMTTCATYAVSIHAPAREATQFVDPRERHLVVSIHAPAREATWMPPVRRWRSCFNPRPRAGSDIVGRGPSRIEQVSIHAPAREATSSSTRARSPMRFNPRSRAGSDVPRPRLLASRSLVSIHAPAREATPRCETHGLR